MRKELLLIVNPNAGQRRANRFLPEIIQHYNSAGFDCVVYVTSGVGDAKEYMVKHMRAYDRIVCIGGDGTLNETVAGAIMGGYQGPVGYIPAGSTNDFAMSLRISTDIMQACADSIAGVACELDLGEFNGRYFNYTASCGAFAKTSYQTSQIAKNALGHLAYIMGGIADIPSIHPIHIRFEADGMIYENDYIFCSVTNSTSIGGILKLDPRVVSLDDGKFEVMLIQYPKSPLELPRIIAALNNMDFSIEEIEFFTASELKIHSAEELDWTVDGEHGASGHDFEVINHRRKMKLILPAGAQDQIPIQKKNNSAAVEYGNTGIID